MGGFPLTTHRLREQPLLGRIPVLGCSAESDDANTDAKMGSDSESYGSLNECSNQAVVIPGRSPVKEAGFNVFHATLGHAHESLLKTTAKSTGVKLPGTLRRCKGCMLAKSIRAPIA